MDRTTYTTLRRAYRATAHQRRLALHAADCADSSGTRRTEIAAVNHQPRPAPPVGYDRPVLVDVLKSRLAQRQSLARAKAELIRCEAHQAGERAKYDNPLLRLVCVDEARSAVQALRGALRARPAAKCRLCAPGDPCAFHRPAGTAAPQREYSPEEIRNVTD